MTRVGRRGARPKTGIMSKEIALFRFATTHDAPVTAVNCAVKASISLLSLALALEAYVREWDDRAMQYGVQVYGDV